MEKINFIAIPAMWIDDGLLKPNPDKPVEAKRKSRIIGELKIED